MSREQNRARFPELARIKDEYGPDARIVYAEDATGSIGREPEPEFSLSAAFVVFALTYGQGRK